MMAIKSTTAETWQNGVLIDTRTVTWTTSPEQDNDETIRSQAAGALAGNRTYIAAAIGSTTAARLSALESQVKALSQQNNRLIRLALNLLDGTD